MLVSNVEGLLLLVLELRPVPTKEYTRERPIHRDKRFWKNVMQGFGTRDQLRFILHDREGVDQVPQSVRNAVSGMEAVEPVWL